MADVEAVDFQERARAYIAELKRAVSGGDAPPACPVCQGRIVELGINDPGCITCGWRPSSQDVARAARERAASKNRPYVSSRRSLGGVVHPGVRCPRCNSDRTRHKGRSPTGAQRHMCSECGRHWTDS